jgi:outer membrane protein TolC
MRKMKSMLVSILLIAWATKAYSQDSLTLDQALEYAKQHYPLARQQGLIQSTKELSLASLNRGYLPQVSINGQASTQSEVTRLPFSSPLPAFQMEPLDRDQYRITADLQQVVYDGGAIERQKKIQELQAGTEQEKLNVELQKVRERVRILFLGLLLIDEQEEQARLTRSDVEAGIKKQEAAVKFGTALRSQLAVLQAERLRVEQRITELKASRKTLLETLSLFTGTDYAENIRLVRPSATVSITNDNRIRRPELRLLEVQDSLTQTQRRLLSSRSLPRLSLFAQGGYGRPGLNMLLNEFDWFYLAGARFQWNLGGLYSLRKERKINSLQQSTIQLQKESYLLQANATVTQCRNEMEKYYSLIRGDDEIIALREEVKRASKAQLDNGVITSSDYLREVNAAEQARLSATLHRLQLLQTQLEYLDYTEKP